jgi:hypothetical protein
MHLTRTMTVTAAAAFVVALSYGCTTTVVEPVPDDAGSDVKAPPLDASADHAHPDTTPPDTDASMCAPVDISTFTPPAYVSAKKVLGTCTVKQISDYDSMCNTSPYTGCSAWQAVTANKACLGCLVSKDTDNPWGALVEHTMQGVSNDNVAGCIEIEGNLTCAKAYEALSACEDAACPPSVCPVTDQTTFTAYEACAKSADSGACKTYASAVQACQGVDDGGPISTICQGGTDFHSIFLAISPVFCGYPDGG